MSRVTQAVFLPLAVLSTTLLASCDAADPLPGHVSVQYEFRGTETPSRVSLYLLPKSTALDCDTLSGNPFDLATEQARSMPVSGTATFTELEAGSEWVIVASGALDGSEVATGCVDGITIKEDETQFVQLTLENNPLDIQGTYISYMEFNSGLPIGLIGAALTYDAFHDDFIEWVCSQLEDCSSVEDDDTQAVVTKLLTLLSSLDVEAEWTFRQSGDLVNGNLRWRTVEGVVVDESRWNLIEGTLAGEIPGSTQILFNSTDLRVKSEELTLFLLEEVMERELTNETEILDPIMPDMQLSTGTALAIDDDFTGQADRVSGRMHAILDFRSLGFYHDFDMLWTASRSNQ